MNSPADVIAKLATLGDPRQIADHLLAAGIRGDHHAYSCPVAQYVQREAGVRVSVDHFNWAADAPDFNRLPDDVARFVQAFDFGFFPELEAEDES